VLREMREQNLPYYRFALGYSNRWKEHFDQHTLDPAEADSLRDESTASLARQQDIEAADELSFEDYLAAYYRQYEAIQAGD
jgi:glutamate--cysteine ligase